MLYGLIKVIVQEVLGTSILAQEGLFNSFLALVYLFFSTSCTITLINPYNILVY